MKRKIPLFVIIVAMLFMVGCGDSSNHEGEAKTPSGSSVQKGREYQEVVEDFEEKGFTNIQVVPIYDLVTGWMTKDGEVEAVSVDGDENYAPDRWYANDVEVIISYHTFPEETDDSESIEAENSSIPEPQESTEAEEVIFTKENCEEFAAMLAVTSEIDPLYSVFANGYKGATIEFDGCITYVTNHGDYDTRYDILLSAGDYVDENTANPGPIFKFEDVNTMNLGIDDLFLPDFVKDGNNVHIIAEVLDFNADTGLFFLKPISILER